MEQTLHPQEDLEALQRSLPIYRVENAKDGVVAVSQKAAD
jgi:hypothetical protein